MATAPRMTLSWFLTLKMSIQLQLPKLRQFAIVRVESAQMA
jgi:hypothetical protein